MIRLTLPTEPRWITLPQGVEVLVKPITTAIVFAAQVNARKAIEKLDTDASADETLRSGLAFQELVESLARYAVIDWRGVVGADGAPLPCTPDNAAMLMRLDSIAVAFWDTVFKPLRDIEEEGNGFAPARDGSSARAGSIAAAVEASTASVGTNVQQ